MRKMHCRHLAKPINSEILKFRFFFAFFSIVTPMSFLCANLEFVLLTDFELSMVAKPMNSISAEKVVKNLKK